MNKFQRLQSLYPCHGWNQSHKISSKIAQSGRFPAHMLFRKGMQFTTDAIEASMIEKGKKDIIRVAAIYAMCGTAASYLDMMYNGKVFILKWTVPSPERFLMCAFCWGFAGCTSWLLFWSRSDILIRAAAARVRYGLVDGSRTSMMALGTSGASIAAFSIYFDYIDYRTKKSQYLATMTPSIMGDFADSGGIGNPNGVIPPTEHMFDEESDNMDDVDKLNAEDDEDDISDSMILGENASNVLISSKTLRTRVKKKIKNVENSRDSTNGMSKPEWNWDTVVSNVYQPCKIFTQCNGAIWLLFGTFTGVITARIMTHSVLMNGIGAAYGSVVAMNTRMDNICEFDKENEIGNDNVCQILCPNDTNMKLSDTDEKCINSNEIELFRFPRN